jgi:hypothetical protein
MVFVLQHSMPLKGQSALDRRHRGLTASLPARLPMVLDLLVLLALLLQALCVVACHLRRRLIMLRRALTMPLHHSSHHNLFKRKRRLRITSSSRHSLTASQTPTMVLHLMLVAYPHLRHRHLQAWPVLHPKVLVRDRLSRMGVQPVRHPRFDQSSSIAQAPLATVIPDRTNTILITLRAAVSRVVLPLQRLL